MAGHEDQDQADQGADQADQGADQADQGADQADQGAKALLKLREVIELRQFTSNPVSAVLILTYRVKVKGEDITTNLRTKLHNAMRKTIGKHLNQAVALQAPQNPVVVTYESPTDNNTHFFTTSGYLDQIKAYAMKKVIIDLNNRFTLIENLPEGITC